MEAAEFYHASRVIPLLDTRSPAEYEEGHIPGALSFPLFSNDERALVGTTYKRQGKDEAVKLGLELVGPKLKLWVEQAQEIAPAKELALYCWRGGMRSGSMAWLLQTAGFRVHRLQGGYKAYRTWMRDQFQKPAQLRCIGGMTGTGKTAILHALRERGEQVLDLEGIARHYGSAFGHIHSEGQPTTAHFNNLVLEQWLTLDHRKRVWVEDESKHIGKVWLDEGLFQAVKSAPFILLETSMDDRVKWLCEMYGSTSIEALKEGFTKIGKRLGPQHVKAACAFLDQGDLASAARIGLEYYDKSYGHLLGMRQMDYRKLNIAGKTHQESAQMLLDEITENG
ncbi:MAG: tRNA 2-selenouridine(34) synthase MnmH [Flavobacteriales bacterium]|nr:tRNA 2-selenouridine(34) synthase MnmH [Flavobacteriales bacterium]